VGAGALLVISNLVSGRDPTENALPPSAAPDAPSQSPSYDPQPLPIASAVDFDPEGADGHENPTLVPAAIDHDPKTAWRTVSYRSSTMDPKSGTGLILDLGLVRPISGVRLEFEGTGTDVEIRIGNQQGRTARDYELLAGAVAAGKDITLRTPIPVQTRYVLVWLTNLPYAGDGYQGGIREVEVLG
jgi:hypothetical protein